MNDIPDRSHNNPPELLPMLPPEPKAEDVNQAFTDREFKGTEAPPYDEAEHFRLSLIVSQFCDACGKWDAIGALQTAEQSERLTDFVNGARKLGKEVETTKKKESEVHDKRLKRVRADFSLLEDKLTAAVNRLKPKQADWLQREQKRIENERLAREEEARAAKAEADRLLAEAQARGDVSGEVEAERAAKEAAKAEKQAARPVKASAQSYTGGGRTMSIRKIKVVEVKNPAQVFMHFRDHPKVLEVLHSLATQAVRAQGYVDGTVPGIVVTEREDVA